MYIMFFERQTATENFCTFLKVLALHNLEPKRTLFFVFMKTGYFQIRNFFVKCFPSKLNVAILSLQMLPK